MDKQQTNFFLKGCQYGCFGMLAIVMLLLFIVFNEFQAKHQTSGSNVEKYQRELELALNQTQFKGDIKVNFWHRTAFSHMAESIHFTYSESNKSYDFNMGVYRGKLDEINYEYYGKGLPGAIRSKMAEDKEQILVDHVKSVLASQLPFKLDRIRLIEGDFISTEHRMALDYYQRYLHTIHSIHDDLDVAYHIEKGAKVFSVTYILNLKDFYQENKSLEAPRVIAYRHLVEEINKLAVDHLMNGTYVFHAILENSSGGYDGVKQSLILYIRNGKVVNKIEKAT